MLIPGIIIHWVETSYPDHKPGIIIHWVETSYPDLMPGIIIHWAETLHPDLEPTGVSIVKKNHDQKSLFTNTNIQGKFPTK